MLFELPKKQTRFRRAEDVSNKLSIVQLIRGENLRFINTRAQQPIGGFDIDFTLGKLTVELAVGSRHGEWVKALMEVRDKCQKLKRSRGLQHYKLATTGGLSSGRVRFKLQVSLRTTFRAGYLSHHFP